MHLIPFAEVFGSDFLVLDYRENASEPSVGLWYHELSEVLAPMVVQCGRTLHDFLAALEDGI